MSRLLNLSEYWLHQVESQLVQQGNCRVWTGRKSHNGYGIIKIARNDTKVHRLVFVVTNRVEPISVLHTCDNRACAFISHLVAGNQESNVHDALHKGRQKGRPITTSELALMKNLRASGLTYKQIAEQLGRGAGIIYNTLQRRGRR